MRNNCAICKNEIVFLYQKKNTPITFAPTLSDYGNDIYLIQDVYVCNNCGCVQLKDLIDPTILYSTSHNNTFNTPTWKEHHNKFVKFVLDNCTTNSILEIGGSSGVFYNLFKQNSNHIKYTCMDLCDQITDTSIPFIKGNCETYEFRDTETIVMSHVFEHLYNPSDFVENISNCDVKNVFISIPNMEHLLTLGSPSIIFNEHTYYVDIYLINWLFSNYGYKLTQLLEFKKHSLFIKFEKVNVDQKIELVNNKNIAIKMLEIHNMIEERFKLHNIPPNSFIVPAGHLGQLFYTIAKPEHIIGFLDNDLSKQGHRVYGTPYYVFSFDKLKEYNNESVHIFIYGGLYTDELIAQIKLINPNTIIHII